MTPRLCELCGKATTATISVDACHACFPPRQGEPPITLAFICCAIIGVPLILLTILLEVILRRPFWSNT